MGFLFNGPRHPVSNPYPYAHMSYIHDPYQQSANPYHPSGQYSFPFPYSYNPNEPYPTNPIYYQDSNPNMNMHPQFHTTPPYSYEQQYPWNQYPYSQSFHPPQYRDHSFYHQQANIANSHLEHPNPNDGIL